MRPGFLAGLRVLELGDGAAGAATTNLLQLFGAEVTAVVDPASPHRAARPLVEGPDGPTSLLSIILDRHKQLRPLGDVGDLGALVAGYDLVVADRVQGPRGPLARLGGADGYAEFVGRVNRGGWVTISAFGLTGARRDDVATDLTLAAASGMLGSVRNPATGKPVKLAGRQSSLVTGQAGALASCHAVDLARHGDPAHLDLAAVEATIAVGPPLALAATLLATGGGGGAARYGAPASFYPCLDGQVRISAMEDHQWHGVIAAMGSPAWTERFSTVQSRIHGQDEIDQHVAAWTSRFAQADAEALLQSHGVPATAVYSPAETLDSPQFRYRGSFEAIAIPDGREATIVGERFQVIEPPGAQAAPAPERRSLRGLRVLEMSHVLAGPLAGALLGALGARVTKLEDLNRIDMYRRRGPYIDGREGGERSAFFALMNHSKQSVAFDLEADPARLDALLDESDVVVENLGGKRAARIGLAASVLGPRRPELLVVSSSGFGQEGPRAGFRAYAYNLQASCLLGYLTRDDDGTIAEIDQPWGDLISAYALATLVAAWAVGPNGNSGAAIDFAMADLVVSHFNDALAAASLGTGDDLDWGNDAAPFAPNGVYPTEDGWVALCIADDEQLACLAGVLGEDRLADFAGDRFPQRRALDALVAAATRPRKAAILAAELRAGGVVAEEVVDPLELPAVEQLASRDFFTQVVHPEWGERRIVGIPWRPYGKPAIALTHAPLLEP